MKEEEQILGSDDECWRLVDVSRAKYHLSDWAALNFEDPAMRGVSLHFFYSKNAPPSRLKQRRRTEPEPAQEKALQTDSLKLIHTSFVALCGLLDSFVTFTFLICSPAFLTAILNSWSL